MSEREEIEKCVIVCPQCEGEGGYPDGLDEAAVHVQCTRCESNGWIADADAILSRHKSSPLAGVEEIERNVRVAIWNAIKKQAGGDDWAYQIINAAMAEPTMLAALASLKPAIDVDAEQREVTLRVRPVPTEDWSKLPKREQHLNAIGDVIGYWIKWVTGQHEAENLTVTVDTHIVLPGENAPPHWPSMGQLGRWLEVLRDSDSSAALASSDPLPVLTPKQIADYEG